MSLSRRQLIAIATAATLLLLAIGVGIYGLLTGPQHHPDQHTEVTPSARDEPEPSSSSPVAPRRQAPLVPHTPDPIVYARAVASILLTWDTMAAANPAEHVRPLLADADPDRIETPGLARDLARYLPTPEAWQQLRHYHTTQTATIHAAYIPSSWADIATSAGAEHLRDGTVAVTIDATRHRSGSWLDEPAAADHPATFTIFAACPPAFDRCHLLRLSQLDNPLR